MKTNFDYHLRPLILAETAVSALLNGNLIEADLQKSAGPPSPSSIKAKKSAGILTIRGTLFPSTYQRVETMLEEMVKQYEAVILDINSPGGLVAGCYDLSDRIYFLRQKTPIYSVVGESCYSAAYCLASATNKIYLARSAGVGSVGVIAVHVDQSSLNEKVGLKITPIYSGAKKNDRSPHFPISERAMADLQKSIDDCYDIFCATVARNRGMLVDSVKRTEAGIYYGKEAIDVGFVDAIASRREAIADIISAKNEPTVHTGEAPTPAPKATTPKASITKGESKSYEPSPLVLDAQSRANAGSIKENPLLANAKVRSKGATHPEAAAHAPVFGNNARATVGYPEPTLCAPDALITDAKAKAEENNKTKKIKPKVILKASDRLPSYLH